MSLLSISKSSDFDIFPSLFLSIAKMNCLAYCMPTYLFLPKDRKASVMRWRTYSTSSVPLWSVSYLLKMASMACLSWSSDGLVDIVLYFGYDRWLLNWIINGSILFFYFNTFRDINKYWVVFNFFCLKNKWITNILLKVVILLQKY